MVFYFENNQLIIEIPNKNKGKFRFKERNNQKLFGDSFPTRNKSFNKNVYLEWQIGYDVYTGDLRKRKRKRNEFKILYRR